MESSLSLDFLEYWRALRGFDRTTASVMLGEWLLAVDQARREAAGVGAFDDVPDALMLGRQAKRSRGDPGIQSI